MNQSVSNSGTEPLISVGLISGAGALQFELAGDFYTVDGVRLPTGNYTASASGSGIQLTGPVETSSDFVLVSPSDFDRCKFTLHGVTIGIDFHWERKESQVFQGALAIKRAENGLIAINRLPLEPYLLSVISSEMSASSPPAMLKAHAIISRSWLLAQLASKDDPPIPVPPSSSDEIIRWYTREAHSDFDVCSDDHCQRYQGIAKAFSQAAKDASQSTRGIVLTYDGGVCDARYSKCCGGMTERYSAAWDDRQVPYLSPVYDGLDQAAGSGLKLSIEQNARNWIESSPDAFCKINSTSLLSRILPGFDQETSDFYRWRITYNRDELAGILKDRIGLDLGTIRGLEASERGNSGRIIRLKITGNKGIAVIGKELEIRRALSRSHLFSSAFVVHEEFNSPDDKITLVGAGWGHGVGLCQIGAGAMADLGYGHEAILAHYFAGSTLSRLYD